MIQTITNLENIRDLEKLKEASYTFGSQPIIDTFSQILEESMEEEREENSGFLPMFIPLLVAECMGKNSAASAGEAIYRELHQKLYKGSHHG